LTFGSILWLEGGTSAGTGSPHQAEIHRDEFGVPESLSNKALRFIYFGNNQWRLKLAKRGAESWQKGKILEQIAVRCQTVLR
jgi:hypothetical protein